MPVHWKRYVFRQVTAPLANLFPSRQATIGELSDKVLLNIFRYILDLSPRYWSRLVHTCCKWRRVVFASHRALQLRLFCTYRTPVQKILYCWPSYLDIVVEYGGSPELDPPAPEDENNILASLEQSNRVTSISLTITSSLLEKLSAIESRHQLSELENLNILSRARALVTLPRIFWWCPRLSCLRLSGIAFSPFFPLLHTSKNLVDVQLHDVLGPWPFLPHEFAHILSGMTQLRSLSLHLPSAHGSISSSPRLRERIVVPLLTRLSFRGTTTYLEDMVARIDAPRLGDIELTFLDYGDSGLSILGQFIDRVELHKSDYRAHIPSPESGISITFIHAGAPMCFILKLICKSLTVLLSSMARIRAHFPALLLNVEDLRITVGRKSRQEDFLNGKAWLELIASFASVKWFHAPKNLLTSFLHALRSPHTQRDTVLPVLYKLYVSQPGPPHAPFMDEIVSLMISRQLSGHPIVVEYERLYGLRDLSKKLSETGTTYPKYHHLPLTCLE